MATSSSRPVVLTVEECWGALGSTGIARLAIITPDGPDIYPLDYLAHGERLAFRSVLGPKLDHILADPRVALEMEGDSEHGMWTIVVRGVARRSDDPDEIASFGLLPHEKELPRSGTWAHMVVEVTQMSGRRFPGIVRRH